MNTNPKIGPELQALLTDLQRPADKPLWQYSKEARAKRVAAGLYATKGGNKRDMRARARAAYKEAN